MSRYNPKSLHNDPTEIVPTQQRYYYAEISAQTITEQSQQIEQVITLALDVLDAQHIEVRVAQARACACA